MEQAYRNVFRKSPPRLSVTHRYISFAPSSYAELDRLERSNIELFDFPLDHETISEGDYFPQPGRSEEDIPVYYAVVSSADKLPEGIPVKVLAEMHIPDNEPAWENEALRLTGNLLDYGEFGMKQELPPIEPVEDNGKCYQYPSGRIAVRKKLLTDNGLEPIQKVTVVVRRLFKIERMQTDPNGSFQARKYFRNKYTILVKFKNEFAHISRTRPGRIFEQFFPITINFGKWDQLDCMHEFEIGHTEQAGTIGASHWAAATTHNAIIAYHGLCTRNGVLNPDHGLHIMLSSKKNPNHGNTYMMQSIMEDNSVETFIIEGLTIAILTTFNPVTAAATIALTAFLKVRAPDITYGYGGDGKFLVTDQYNELVMHELAHASHYRKVGALWWARFGIAESSNEGEGPYGQCCTEKAAITALGEAWAYYIGHLFTDQRYGLQSTTFPEQGVIDQFDHVILFSNQYELSSHLYFLESFNPRRHEDPSSWVPKGLFYDMSDGLSERFTSSRIIDEVEGFTSAQFLGVMTRDVKNIQEFKQRFIEFYGRQQEKQINRLFAQYGY